MSPAYQRILQLWLRPLATQGAAAEAASAVACAAGRQEGDEAGYADGYRAALADAAARHEGV